MRARIAFWRPGAVVLPSALCGLIATAAAVRLHRAPAGMGIQPIAVSVEGVAAMKAVHTMLEPVTVSPKISAEQAERVALADYPGLQFDQVVLGRVHSTSDGFHNGRIVWLLVVHPTNASMTSTARARYHAASEVHYVDAMTGEDLGRTLWRRHKRKRTVAAIQRSLGRAGES